MLESELQWSADDPSGRRPILTRSNREFNNGQYNTIGFHGGLWGFHTRFSGVLGHTDLEHIPNYDHTHANCALPQINAENRGRVVTLDPFGYDLQTNFKSYLTAQYKIHPTGALNRRLVFNNPRVTYCVNNPHHELNSDGEILRADGEILARNGDYKVTQLTMDQVWYLKGMADKLGISEEVLRRKLFDSLGGEAFPQLIDDDRVQAFLPPIGGISVRIFGDLKKLGDPDVPNAVRLHDFCHDGDAGACICSCCIYRDFAVKRCIQIAQSGGLGIMIEGLDEATGYGLVAKHTIYNGRDNHPDGDDYRNYFSFRRAINGRG
jgi:GTP cyclohydrolase II